MRLLEWLSFTRWRMTHPLRKRAPVTAAPSMWAPPEILWWERCDVCQKFRVGPAIYREIYPSPEDCDHGWWHECEACYRKRDGA